MFFIVVLPADITQRCTHLRVEQITVLDAVMSKSQGHLPVTVRRLWEEADVFSLLFCQQTLHRYTHLRVEQITALDALMYKSQGQLPVTVRILWEDADVFSAFH